MKIIFLDLDGVLNSSSFLSKKGRMQYQSPAKPNEKDVIDWIVQHCPDDFDDRLVLLDALRSLDRKAVALLNILVEGSGAKVVISSSWRVGHSPPALQRMLEHKGFRGKVIDATPSHVPSPTGFLEALRGHEIQVWLTKHPGVSHFVILDDDDDMAHLKKHLVQTDRQEGLASRHVEQALKLLRS